MTNVGVSYSHTEPFGGQTRRGNRGPKGLLSNGLDFGDDDVVDSGEIFARNLKFWLQKRKISGAELGRRIGVERATVSAWLTGVNSPNVKLLGDIAAVLEIPVRDLLYDATDLPAAPQPTVEDEEEKILKYIAKSWRRKVKVGPKE